MLEIYIRLFPTTVLIDKKENIENKKASFEDIESYLVQELGGQQGKRSTLQFCKFFYGDFGMDIFENIK